MPKEDDERAERRRVAVDSVLRMEEWEEAGEAGDCGDDRGRGMVVEFRPARDDEESNGGVDDNGDDGYGGSV